VNLEGSLDAFGLADVFSLLAMTTKSGALRLRRTAPSSGKADGVVWFSDGLITGASADLARQSLTRRLVGSGIVDDAALRGAVNRVQSAGSERDGVARALLDSGAVEPELLQAAASDQILDAVFDLMRWTDGEFTFDMVSANPDDVGVAVEVSGIIDESRAREAAWIDVSTIIPSPDSILSVPVVLSADPVVSRDEWALLALVDGRRCVRDLVDLTGAGQFAVVSTLASLVRRGLLVVRDVAAADHVGVVERRMALLTPLEDFDTVGESLDSPPEEPADLEPVDPQGRRRATLSGPGGDDEDGTEDYDDELDDDEDDDLDDDDTSTDKSARRTGPKHKDVVPSRSEPFLPSRRAPQADGPASRAEASAVARASGLASVPTAGGPPSAVGSAAVAVEEAADPSGIDRDPSINRSLLLRLIAGVRGL
jgi:hypothetical protein